MEWHLPHMLMMGLDFILVCDASRDVAPMTLTKRWDGFVAPIYNRQSSATPASVEMIGFRGLQIRDTADCKSALRQAMRGCGWNTAAPSVFI
jgi:hypothetical protein